MLHSIIYTPKRVLFLFYSMPHTPWSLGSAMPNKINATAHIHKIRKPTPKRNPPRLKGGRPKLPITSHLPPSSTRCPIYRKNTVQCTPGTVVVHVRQLNNSRPQQEHRRPSGQERWWHCNRCPSWKARQGHASYVQESCRDQRRRKHWPNRSCAHVSMMDSFVQGKERRLTLP